MREDLLPGLELCTAALFGITSALTLLESQETSTLRSSAMLDQVNTRQGSYTCSGACMFSLIQTHMEHTIRSFLGRDFDEYVCLLVPNIRTE